MKWIAFITNDVRQKFIIEPTTLYNTATGTRHSEYQVIRFFDGQCTHDYLQEDLQGAKQCALREFNVPLDAWQQVED